MSGTYKDLEVWQCAMALVLEVYRSTAKFPREEMFGLSQPDPEGRRIRGQQHR
jgi:hypothetical protein